jgi:ElaB/YqjD/DUF883 family membrane-anchored ribosome-binding protein
LNRLKSLLETGRLPEGHKSDSPQWRQRTVEYTRKAADAADAYVRENPWLIAACVALTCFSVGFLLGRRRDASAIQCEL